MSRRKSFNNKERARLFDLRGGICHLCTGKIDATTQAWEIEHVIEWSLTRDDSDDNLALAHKTCHRLKTSERAGVLAHVTRMATRNIGAVKPTASIPSRPPQHTANTIRRAKSAKAKAELPALPRKSFFANTEPTP